MPTASLSPLALPLFLCHVEAGFPSPADDHLDRDLDLMEHVVRRPSATYFTRVSGHSMREAGIHDGDLLVVDSSLTPRNGDVVVAAVRGDLTVKRYRRRRGRVWLEAAHPDYPPIEVGGADATVWGVVTHSLRYHRRA